LIAVLYLLIPLSIIGYLGVGVSLKYEVDHGRIFTEMNDNLTDEQRELEMREIYQLEEKYHRELMIYGLIGFVGLIVPTGLIIQRLKREKVKTSPNKS